VKAKSFLEHADWINRMRLSVTGCQPSVLPVDTELLVKRQVPVVCLDEHRMAVAAAKVSPPQAEVLVRGGWRGSATVVLAQDELAQARSSPIEKYPFVEVAPGQTKQAGSPVEVTMPAGLPTLKNYTITTATLGVTLSINLQGRYRVEVTNLDEVVSAIRIVATADAKMAYENMPYQVVLEIDDSDAESAEPLRREAAYNFPDEYIDKGQIRLDQQPVMARFKLTAIGSVTRP
jgi:hypothetical protein